MFCNSCSTLSWPECTNALVLQQITINLIILKLQNITSVHWKISTLTLRADSLDTISEISEQNSEAAVFTTVATRANRNSTIMHICLRCELRNQKFSIILRSAQKLFFCSTEINYLDISKYTLNNYLFQLVKYTKIWSTVRKDLKHRYGCMGHCLFKENQVIKGAEFLSKILKKCTAGVRMLPYNKFYIC